MFTKSAASYGAIDAERIDIGTAAGAGHALTQAYTRPPGNTLLEVAPSTGPYLAQLRPSHSLTGRPQSGDAGGGPPEAAGRSPAQADLVEFELRRQFDAVVCLGSSIGYVETMDRLPQAIGTLARHSMPGGVIVIEPWFS
jgi:hypothetical protein